MDARKTWIAVTVAGLLAVTALGFVLKSRLPEPGAEPASSPDTILTVPPVEAPPAPEPRVRAPGRKSPDAPQEVAAEAFVATPSGLKIHDFVEGTGAAPQAGQTALVDYTGWIQGGRKFDSSLDRDDPLPVEIGTGLIIPGWEEGITSMKVGGKRQIVIPPEIAYGSKGRPPMVPPNATLVFEMELVDVK